MSTFDLDYDYLQLLGIDPADALRAPSALVEKVKVKKKEWTAQALNPLYQQAARSNLERAREFEELLGADPAALAAYVDHIKKCRLALRAEHEENLMLLVALACAGKGELTAKQRELLVKEAKAEGFPDSLLDEILKSRGIAIVAAAAKKAAAEVPKLPLQTPALDGVVLGEIQKWLKVLNKKSLYELLDLPNSTPPPRLVSTAQLLFAHWSKVQPKTNVTTAWEKTLQACSTYLKDADSKAKYDRGLFNQRIQKMASRIDLVLAGTTFGAEEQALVTKLGVLDFGFTAPVIEQCLSARMAEKGVAPESRATIVIQAQGQIRCRRCGAWNGQKQSLCRECSSSLHRKCENPSCRAAPLPVDAKACTACGLPTARAIKYRTLLRMADAFLESGSHQAALSVCQLAAQILPGPAIEDRLDRAGRIRELAATARTQAAAQAWTAVSATLKDLVKLAPRVAIPGVPTLEKVTQYVADSAEKFRAVPADTAPVEAAKIYLGVLRRWSDCEEAFQKLRTLCARLESDRDPKRALQLSLKLLEIRPGDAALSAAVARLEPLARVAEEQEADRQAAIRDYLMAVRENRLYTAERSIQAIEALAGAGPGLPSASVDEVHRKLADVQRELNEVKALAAEQTRTDPIIQRYLNLLGRCRDCREALLALQSVAIDAPDPPENLTVRREGNRRVLSWRPASSGKRTTSYVVQRSITRPGSRQVDPPFQTIYEGDAVHFSDDEIAHGGVILRYMVHAIARGKIDVEGTTVRTFEVASAPSAFPGVLIWQEVMNLRSTRRDRALELTWFSPPGCRHVLIERWPGGPEDRSLGVAILPATAEGRLVDEGLGDRMAHTYRISCVYDGPDGDFRTPGVSLTDAIIAVAAPARSSEHAQDPGAGVPSSNGT